MLCMYSYIASLYFYFTSLYSSERVIPPASRTFDDVREAYEFADNKITRIGARLTRSPRYLASRELRMRNEGNIEGKGKNRYG